MPLLDASVLAHITDVHCHAGEFEDLNPADMDALAITICAMSSNRGDQARVRSLAERWPEKVIPAFGYHPWWAHQVAVGRPESTEAHYRSLFLPAAAAPHTPALEAAFARLLPSLPDPIPLDDIMAEVRANLVAHPNAMVGEVGLDQAARVPFPLEEDIAAEGRKDDSWRRGTLSPFNTPLAHQLAILEAQLALAAELRRNVSVHSVKAPLPTRSLLDRMASTHGARWRAISVDLHSCGVSVQVWTDIEVRRYASPVSGSRVQVHG